MWAKINIMIIDNKIAHSKNFTFRINIYKNYNYNVQCLKYDNAQNIHNQ